MAVAVVLLTDPEARRAVVSWPLVPPGLKGRRRIEAWARVSGLPPHHLETISEMLLAHEICREDRSIDPDALRVIQHFAAETLRPRTRKKGPTP